MSNENTATYQNSGFGIRNAEKEDRKSGVRSAVKTTGTTIQATGTAVQVGGAAMQAAGVATKVAGAGISAAGAGLSATGVGAVVGAPLMAIGRVVGVGGSAVQAGGKAVSKTGSTIRRTGSSIKRSTKSTLGKVKLLVHGPFDLSNFLFLSWLGTLWFMQFICAILAIIMLGVGGGIAALYTSSGWYGQTLKSTFDLIKTLTSFNFDIADHFGSLFMLFDVLALLIGFTSLMLVAFKTILGLDSPFWGEGAPVKISVFLIAIVGYTIPLANLFPWVLPWAVVLMYYRN